MQRSAAAAAWTDVLNPLGKGGAVLVCEHASNFIPPEYSALGLDERTLRSHVAWDPGARDIALQMSEILDAPLVLQNASRLLYDCNRPPESAGAIPAKSEVFDIPGNAGLSEAARKERVATFYQPFRQTLGALLEDRLAQGTPTALVTIHSFTPVFHGSPRSVEIGVLHDSDARLADLMLSALAGPGDIEVARNQPYGPQDGVTHTLVEHGISRGLPNVMIEIRNDLISGKVEQAAMAQRIAAAIVSALSALRSANARGR